jgi:hypothetical protein
LAAKSTAAPSQRRRSPMLFGSQIKPSKSLIHVMFHVPPYSFQQNHPPDPSPPPKPLAPSPLSWCSGGSARERSADYRGTSSLLSLVHIHLSIHPCNDARQRLLRRQQIDERSRGAKEQGRGVGSFLSLRGCSGLIGITSLS